MVQNFETAFRREGEGGVEKREQSRRGRDKGNCGKESEHSVDGCKNNMLQGTQKNTTTDKKTRKQKSS